MTILDTELCVRPSIKMTISQSQQFYDLAQLGKIHKRLLPMEHVHFDCCLNNPEFATQNLNYESHCLQKMQLNTELYKIGKKTVKILAGIQQILKIIQGFQQFPKHMKLHYFSMIFYDSFTILQRSLQKNNDFDLFFFQIP